MTALWFFIGYCLVGAATYHDAMAKAAQWRAEGKLEPERTSGEDEVVAVLSGAVWPFWWTVTFIDVVRYHIWKVRGWLNDK